MNPEESNYNLFDSEQNTGPDIKKYFFKALKYWYLFFIFLPAAYIVAVIINRYKIPNYGLHTTILLKTGSSEEEIAGGLQFLKRSRNMQTEIGILNSYKLNKQTIDSLDFEVSYFLDNKWKSNKELYKNVPFKVIFDNSKKQYYFKKVKIKVLSENSYKLTIDDFEKEQDLKFGQTFEYKDFKFKIEKNPAIFNNGTINKEFFFFRNTPNSLINNFKARLKVEVSPESSSILWLWTESPTPQKDADYLNMLSKIFIARGLEEKNAKAESIIGFIDQQLSGVQDSLQKHQNELQLLKEKNKTLDISSEAKFLMEEQRKLEETMQSLKNNQEYYKYMLNETQNSNYSALVSPSILDIKDEILSGYIVEIFEIITKKKLLSFDLKTEIPNSKKLDYKIKQVAEKIQLHIKKINNINQQKIEDAKRKLTAVNNQIKQLPASERNIINTQRIFNINDATYTLLLTRRTEAAITQASNKADAEVLDIARPENAVNKTTSGQSNIQKALLIGFMLPIIIIVLLEFLNNKIEERNDIETRTKIPIISTIINNSQKGNNPVLTAQKSPIAESFRTLRTNLMFVLKEKSPAVVMVSSTISGEGKTFISQNLASVLALSGRKTLLIGLDLRRPKLQKTFNYHKDKGISTYLSKKHKFDEIIQETNHENLDIALSGPIPPNPAELIESEQMKILIDEAKKQYEFVIIDTPPVAIVTDALLLTKMVDTFLYVVRQNYSAKNVVNIITEVKKRTEIASLNIILNDAGISGGYGYRYNYGYGRGYYAEDVESKSKFKKFLKKFRK